MTAWTEHSLAVAYQSAVGSYSTNDSDYIALEGEIPQPSFETEITEVQLMTGTVGASPRRQVGRRSGSITFSMPLEGFTDTYDPTSEDPGGTPAGANEVIPMWANLVGNAMGSNNSAVGSNANFIRGLMASVSQYTADGVASATAGSVTVDSATVSDKHDVGQLLVTADGTTDTSPQIGFIKTKSAQTLTLFENAKNTENTATSDTFGTATVYMSDEVSDTAPLTFRWVGESTELCYELLDSYCERFRISWNVGEVPSIEFTYRFWDFRINDQDGELITPPANARIPQIVGSFNGYATLEGGQQCGLEDCSIEWSCTLRETKCHGSDNGVSAITVVRPRTRISCSILHDTDDTIYDSAGGTAQVGQHEWQSKLERGVNISLGIYVGSNVGKIWAALMPNGLLVSTPNVTIADDQVRYQLELEADTYTGDSTDTSETSGTSPLDSIFRMGLG